MAGAGYKLFNTGDVLTAAQVNTYLQEQVVMVFANAAARTTALSGVLAEGMVTYLKDTDALEIYSGAAWVGYGSGDITGITTGATSGLTGGVTSGTADLKLNTTAKGGLLVGTGSGTVSELAVGSNTQVLTADSTTATGLKWAAAGSSFKGVLCTKSASQSISNATWTAITYDTEVYDTDNFHSTSSNTSRLTVPTGLGGYYLITWGMTASNGDVAQNCKLYVNTTDWGSFYFAKNNANGLAVSNGSVIINLSAGDYIEQQVYSGAMSIDSNAQNSRPTRFGMQYLGA